MAQTRSTGFCVLCWFFCVFVCFCLFFCVWLFFFFWFFCVCGVCFLFFVFGSSAVQALAPCSVGLRHDAPGSAAVPSVAARTPLPPTICWLPNGCTLDPIPTQPHHV